MAKHSTLASPRRKPRLLWANLFCLLDRSSGASMSVREMLRQLVKQGYEIQILGATLFDSPKGAEHLREQWGERLARPRRFAEIPDGALTHQLIITRQTQRIALSAVEADDWHNQYLYLLDHFKPDLVWFYGGQSLELLIAAEARLRGIPSAFYLANGHYRNSQVWCRDIDLILTDSQATAEMYRDSLGIVATPVGKFIDPARFVAETHERNNLLFISPSWEKGVSIVIQLALLLEQRRPDITLEVVESRGNWPVFLKQISTRLGTPREHLENVRLTANTDAMHAIYARARVLLAPSLWWESGARVLAEAMLNGIPAIVSNRGGSPGLIEDGGVVLDFPEACYEPPYKHLLSEEELEPLYQAVVAYFDDEARYEEASERAFSVGRDRHHIDVSTRRLTQALAPLINQRAGDKDFLRVQRQQHKHKLTGRAAKPDFSQSPDPAPELVPAKRSATVRLKQSAPASDPTASAPAVAQGAGPSAPAPALHQPAPQPDPSPAQSAAAAPTAASNQDSQATFDWQIQGKLVVLDNRAKLIRDGALDNLLATDAFSILAFDPASEVRKPEQYQDRDDIQVFPHVLLGDGQPATLHACLDPGLSSTLEPLPPEQLPAHQRQGARVLTTLPISTIALDSIKGLESIDWLILDDLSDALAILVQGAKVLEATLLLQARVAFQPTHQRQPSLAELQHWASRHGFRFYRFNDARYHSLFPDDSEARQQLASELQSLDTLFIPSPERLSALDDNRKQKLVFLLHSVFNAHDLAYQVMSQVNELLAKQYLRFVEGQVGVPAAAETTPPIVGQPAAALQTATQAPTAPQPAAAQPALSDQERQILAAFQARATPHEPLNDGEKGLFIDCGGYDGCSAIKFRIKNPAFDCVTFEPNPTLWGYYEGLPTQLIKKAAYTYNGEIKFTQDNIDEDGSSVVRRKKIDFTGQKKNSQFPTIKVECIDLAEFIAQSAQTYDKLILKLDVEGAEYDILDKLIEQDLLRHVSKLHCEFHWQKCGIPQHRHDAIVAKVEETTKILDWDALDFSVHKRGEAQAQIRRLILRELVAGPCPPEPPGGGTKASTQQSATSTVSATASRSEPPSGQAKGSIRDKRLLTKQEALASLSGPTLADFGVELKPLKITSTREVIKMRDELYETTRKTLTQLLNDYHGVRHSERYWDILLHYFLAYRFCSNYISRWNNGLLNDRPDWNAIFAQFPTRETYEFGPKTAALVGTDSLYIAESLMRTGRLDGMSRDKSKSVNANNREAYNKLAQYFASATKCKDAIGINIGSHSPDYWRNEWKKDGVDLIDLPPFSSDTQKSVNWKLRAEIARLDEDSPFHNLKGMWSSLALCLPCEFIEDYPRLVDLTKRLLVGKEPAVVISTLMGMTSWRFVAAQLAEQGVPLHLQQHGGSYGEFPSHIASRIEVRIADKFYTWGWQDQTGKTFPAPAHRLERLAQEYARIKAAKEELLVIASNLRLIPRINERTDLDFEDFENVRVYLSELDKKHLTHTVYRFRRQHGYSADREKEVIERLPEVRFDPQSRSVALAYASASEVIIADPFTTSQWECEYLGIPYKVINKPSPEFMGIYCAIPDHY
ncbi:MAG: FkbM family methyltransferase [Chromatiaceae bacterium]|nr:FkbM family methyltransferase [Chromatiaceae bacterium]